MSARELKRLMKFHDVTVDTLASRTAYHPSSIKRFRSGIRPIGPRAARLLRDGLTSHTKGP